MVGNSPLAAPPSFFRSPPATFVVFFPFDSLGSGLLDFDFDHVKRAQKQKGQINDSVHSQTTTSP